MHASLDGLSVGDAFGECFFGPSEVVAAKIRDRIVPPSPWRYTDDTEMAISVVEVLSDKGVIDQDLLADRFAKRMEDNRGYGAGTYELLCGVRVGQSWRALTQRGFRGMGSFGNGAAMRVAPLGAFFAEDLDAVVEQARFSAEVTHSHAEGIAGAIAVALAAAESCRHGTKAPGVAEFVRAVLARTPRGYTYDAIAEVLSLSDNATVIDAAVALGNGSGVTAPDTVPLCLWVIGKYWSRYEEALWAVVSALGDRDTTCAIVGGVVAAGADRAAIPRSWLQAREDLAWRKQP
jgi:ADP-ribosylglycohydrolase